MKPITAYIKSKNAIALKADKTELSSLASGSPKGTYVTLADLQTAFPSGTTGIYLVTTDGKWYYWSGSAWTAGGVYQSTGIADGAISPTKLNFLKLSSNLLNPDNIIQNQQLDTTTGAIVSSTTNSVYDFAATQPNTTYSFSLLTRVAYYDNNKVFISTVNIQANNPPTFTTPANCYYIRLVINNSYIGKAYFNLGSTLLPYEPYYVNVKYFGMDDGSVSTPKMADGAVIASKTDFVQPSSNLFNKADVTANKSIDTSTGALVDNTGNSVSGFTASLQNTVYSWTNLTRVGFYDVKKVFISSTFLQGPASGTYTTPAGTSFVRLILGTTLLDTTQLNVGASLLAYEPYYMRFKGDPSPMDVFDTQSLRHPDYSLFFNNVICIGDSLTEGSYDGTNLMATNYPYYIQKITKWTVTNAGHSGATPLNYYSTFMLSDYSSFDTAIIFLGQNSGLTDTLVADTTITAGQTYEDYAATNTGTYCKIIEKIKASNPDINFFLCNVPKNGGLDKAVRNSVINQIGAKYSLPVLDLWANSVMDTTNGNVYRPIDDIHYGKIGYLTLAHEILTLMKNSVSDNQIAYKL